VQEQKKINIYARRQSLKTTKDGQQRKSGTV
jgi:hypothetical protein